MTKSEDLELVHYGVKGMRWGVKKSGSDGASRSERREAKRSAKEVLDKPNASYSDRQRANDRNWGGKRYARDVNRKLNQGKTLKEARKTSTSHADRMMRAGQIAVAGFGLVYAGATLMEMSIGGNSSQTQRGKDQAQRIFADENTVELRFNSDNNRWE